MHLFPPKHLYLERVAYSKRAMVLLNSNPGDKAVSVTVSEFLLFLLPRVYLALKPNGRMYPKRPFLYIWGLTFMHFLVQFGCSVTTIILAYMHVYPSEEVTSGTIGTILFCGGVGAIAYLVIVQRCRWSSQRSPVENVDIEESAFEPQKYLTGTYTLYTLIYSLFPFLHPLLRPLYTSIPRQSFLVDPSTSP